MKTAYMETTYRKRAFIKTAYTNIYIQKQLT